MLIRSSIDVKTSEFLLDPCGMPQPSSTSQLLSAEGTKRPRYDETSTSWLRLLSFWPLASTRRPTWENSGGLKPRASYRAMCFGVEMSHS